MMNFTRSVSLLLSITKQLGCPKESEEAGARMLPWFYFID
jgi:hypothetical protein